jgi:SAM-dependent methyltransferase
MPNEASGMRRSYAKLYRNTLRREVFPSEYLVRIFMGSYPGLSGFNTDLKGKKILDIGCGDGRNLRLFRSLGMKIYGTEIDKGIVADVARSLHQSSKANFLKVGFAHELPFKDGAFDYVVSWNSSYYMGDSRGYRPYDHHVAEMCRVCAPTGYVIISVPMRSHSIFANAESVDSTGQYVRIKEDPNGVRNGVVFRLFNDQRALGRAFGKYFDEIGYASIRSSCFGVTLDWHIGVFQKR